MIRLLLPLFFAVSFSIAYAGDLLWPLPDSRTLTGGFADPRPDHFHGGVDLRTQGRNLPVVAPTDGWVERIAVSPPGYGRTLYFRLSDDRTAVFGHLSRFTEALEQILRDAELTAGTYRVDLSFDSAASERLFQRGDTLAFTGSTGIGPPHLHFEIREGAVQTDPLSYFDPVDTSSPVIQQIRWIPLSEMSPTARGSHLLPSLTSKGRVRGTIQCNEPLALLVQSYDPGPWGRNAVPATLRLKRGAHVIFECKSGRVDLLGPRDIYARTVTHSGRQKRQDIRRLFDYPLPETCRDQRIPAGWLSNLDGDTISVEIEDRAGNLTASDIVITSGAWPDIPERDPIAELASGRFTLAIGQDPMAAWITLSASSETETAITPPGHPFGERHSLSYRLNPSDGLRGLYFYERKADGGRRALARTIAGDSLTMSCLILRSGTYGVGQDDTPPALTLSGRQGRIVFRLTDGQSGIDDGSIRCTVDGIAAIPEFEYEERGGTIWTTEPLTRGTHRVVFSASDRSGNMKTWNADVIVK